MGLVFPDVQDRRARPAQQGGIVDDRATCGVDEQRVGVDAGGVEEVERGVGARAHVRDVRSDDGAAVEQLVEGPPVPRVAAGLSGWIVEEDLARREIAERRGQAAADGADADDADGARRASPIASKT